MRTAILISGSLIAEAIKEVSRTNEVASFLAILFLTCMAMDVVEFFHKLKQK